jgi:hypothetical protein
MRPVQHAMRRGIRPRPRSGCADPLGPRSGLRWPSIAGRGRRGRHYLSGDGPLSRDHDQLPTSLADSEGIGTVLLERAEDIGHLSVGLCPRRAPADHNPLTDVGGRKPNLKPVTHAPHRPLRRSASRSVAGLPGRQPPAAALAELAPRVQEPWQGCSWQPGVPKAGAFSHPRSPRTQRRRRTARLPGRSVRQRRQSQGIAVPFPRL